MGEKKEAHKCCIWCDMCFECDILCLHFNCMLVAGCAVGSVGRAAQARALIVSFARDWLAFWLQSHFCSGSKSDRFGWCQWPGWPRHVLQLCVLTSFMPAPCLSVPAIELRCASNCPTQIQGAGLDKDCQLTLCECCTVAQPRSLLVSLMII